MSTTSAVFIRPPTNGAAKGQKATEGTAGGEPGRNRRSKPMKTGKKEEQKRKWRTERRG
jgi:hypothetical protein